MTIFVNQFSIRLVGTEEGLLVGDECATLPHAIVEDERLSSEPVEVRFEV